MLHSLPLPQLLSSRISHAHASRSRRVFGATSPALALHVDPSPLRIPSRTEAVATTLKTFFFSPKTLSPIVHVRPRPVISAMPCYAAPHALVHLRSMIGSVVDVSEAPAHHVRCSNPGTRSELPMMALLAVRCRPANASGVVIEQLSNQNLVSASCMHYRSKYDAVSPSLLCACLPFRACLVVDRGAGRGTTAGDHGSGKDRRFRALLHCRRRWRRLRATHWLARVARVVSLCSTAASSCACRSLH
ncbi:hypothetical protein HDK90DRAFT_219478 [Phyllosticta capitalensis]|uniref:Uncharacterized protein n=1 Tax=Phyllosticta capitalensis TaxID=121624 RepID=A0ABR1YTD5_9PEZI